MFRSLKLMTVAVAAATSVAAPLAAMAAPVAQAAAARAAVKSGLTGHPILLDNKAEFSGYDVAIDASGRAYVGWISDKGSAGRKIHLCTLPAGARQCKGGIQTVNSPPGGFGSSSADGLRVLATPGGLVTLVWQYETVASENGPQGDELAISTSQHGGPLSAPQNAATAPSFGSLLDATLGPNNSVWVVSEKSSVGGVQVRPGLSNSAINVHTPFGVGSARLRFSHGTGALVIVKAGSIGPGNDVATVRNGAISRFSKVGKTWTVGATAGLAATTSGLRLITTTNNATYHPVSLTFNGSDFVNPELTGDLSNCAPNSHDLVADASGRAADVSMECSDVAITNLPDTRHAAVTRFAVHGTFAGGPPQLATTPRGRGWVAWSIESTSANKLMVAPFVLADRKVTVTRSARGNRITVSGPASCLTPVDVPVGITARTARNWHLVSRTLRLGGTILHSATLHGASLAAGKSFALTGTVKFASGSSHVTVTATIRFRSCPNS